MSRKAQTPTRIASSTPVKKLSASSEVVELLLLFVVWYGTSVSYNVYNKKVNNDLSLPWTMGAAQLAIGMIYVLPLFLLNLRKPPTLTKISHVLALMPIVVFNTIGHITAVTAMSAPGGSTFTHVIKASEPLVQVVVQFLWTRGKNVPKLFTGLCLLPVTYGVAYAATSGDLSVATMSKEFTSDAAKLAMTSTVAFALRSILRKNLPESFKVETNLSDPANEHFLSTLLSFVLLFIAVPYFEEVSTIQRKYNEISDKPALYLNLLVTGLSFYLYNEYQNIILSKLGAVSCAVGNTLKRVAIFVGLHFLIGGKEELTSQKIVGCVVAVGGCLAFAICEINKI